MSLAHFPPSLYQLGCVFGSPTQSRKLHFECYFKVSCYKNKHDHIRCVIAVDYILGPFNQLILIIGARGDAFNLIYYLDLQLVETFFLAVILYACVCT